MLVVAHLHGKLCCLCAALPFVAAHGMIWVPPGYSFGEAMFGLDEVRGGSGWGSGTFAGPTGARQPSTPELGQAEHQVCCFSVISCSCCACHLLFMSLTLCTRQLVLSQACVGRLAGVLAPCLYMRWNL